MNKDILVGIGLLIVLFLIAILVTFGQLKLITFIGNKINNKLNNKFDYLMTKIPISHKILLKRNITKVINETLYVVKEKTIFGKEKEYYITLPYIVDYNNMSKSYKENLIITNPSKELFNLTTTVYSKCVGVKSIIMNNEKIKVEEHLIFYKDISRNIIFDDYLLKFLKEKVFEYDKNTNSLFNNVYKNASVV